MAGLIIGVVGKKGGSGKTTVAVNLAGALAELFPEVLVIDSDPQGTALTWRAAAGDTGFPVQVIGLPQAVIHQEASKFAQKYDAVVIDSPSGYQDEQIQRSVMLASSLVVIPVQPTFRTASFIFVSIQR
jgi:chromosome partitioning protein